MHQIFRITVFSLLALAIPGKAVSQDVFIYPQKGQSAEQQDKDKYECYNWAKTNSGFDPMAAPATRTPYTPVARIEVLPPVICSFSTFGSAARTAPPIPEGRSAS